MPRVPEAVAIALIIQSAFASGEARALQADPAERDSVYRAYLGFGDLVRGGRIDPNWLADGNRFWYTEDGPDGPGTYLVDPDGDPVVSSLDADRIGEITATVDVETDGPEPLPIGLGPFGYQMLEILSPDGRWFAHRKDHDLWLRAPSDSALVRLTTDGEEGHEWGEAFEWSAVPGERPWAWWSPDGSKLAVKKVDTRRVPRVAIVQPGGTEDDVEWLPYARPGDPLERRDFYLVDIATRRPVRIDAGLDPEGHLSAAGWSGDGSTWLFVALDRAHRRLDLVAADAVTGEARIILTETADAAFRALWSRPPTMRLLAGGETFLWSSERDGWNHLYLYDIRGNLVRRLTEGRFPVVDVLAVDEEGGWVYFTAHGDRQRPYDTHLYRVGLDGAGFTRLTEEPGQHSIRMSPSTRFFVDTHSSVDRPPATDLRRADGRLIRTLSRADMTALESLGWVVPEEVTVMATDGVTDLHGVLYKPYDFDASRRYPVIEYIYDAWNTTVVQRTFSPAPGGSRDVFPRDHIDPIALAQLGYVVWVMDGRGSEERGRDFRAAGYGGFDRIPDHVAALEQLGRERPYMDLDRVGVFGISAGGGQTLQALFRAPELYDVGVAIAAPAGPRNTRAGGIEPQLGLPDENPEAYEHSVLDEVDALKGKLLIMQGVVDRVVAIDHTFRLVAALIEAEKPYDLLLLPDQGHTFYGSSASYAREAMRRYFLEHLSPDL
ncbi:MAG: DPP IV N-terminal domain-containing protein [Gemmatimonadota bacterium]|nr:DPP IV N-terminal domain-containing protein [Gemmatimonadota bacterium]